jgi:hypothetical protein
MDEFREFEFGTPSRRTTLGKGDLEGSAIPVPSSRRQSGGPGIGLPTPGGIPPKNPVLARRTSSGLIRVAEKERSEADMRPPPANRTRKLSEVGETY